MNYTGINLADYYGGNENEKSKLQKNDDLTWTRNLAAMIRSECSKLASLNRMV